MTRVGAGAIPHLVLIVQGGPVFDAHGYGW